MKQHLNLINGEWVGASFAENRNPSDLTAPLGLYARATVEDTQAAIAAAMAIPTARKRHTATYRSGVSILFNYETHKRWKCRVRCRA